MFVFIKGDLHAENFGSYINRFGVINFGVNDFDEVLNTNIEKEKKRFDGYFFFFRVMLVHLHGM